MKVKEPILIPDDLLIPAGAALTARIEHCADTWNDSEVEELRAGLPQEYHGVPVFWIRKRCINLRKHKTPGFNVNGHGPAKGSRGPGRKDLSPEYKAYLASDEWKQRCERWLSYWGNRCCICNHAGNLDVHHRTYERFKNELFTDCVVLCRPCHELFHDESEVANGEDLF